MCDPTLAIAGQAAGAAQGVVGAFAESALEKAALKSQARIAEINAVMAEQRATQAIRDGQTMASRRKMEGGQVREAQVAAMAANGIVVGEGSSARVLASTDYGTEVDANQIEANAIREALGIKTEALNLRTQAAASRAQASGISPFMSGLTSAIGAATQVADSYYRLKQTGAFGPTSKRGPSDIVQGGPARGRTGLFAALPSTKLPSIRIGG